MTGKRWNQFIDFVNCGRPVTELNPPIRNREEKRIFNELVKELAELRKRDPKAAYWPVDTEC